MLERTIALVDDHILLRNGLSELLKKMGYNILFEVGNGKEMVDKINAGLLPELVLLDIGMPEMDGYSSALWLSRNCPDVLVLALTMYDDETSIIRMLKSGAKGYVLKDSEPSILREAINSMFLKGFYHSELVTGSLIRGVQQDIQGSVNRINEREAEFLKLICTELTYKEIAERMSLSPRTIDGYRDALFEKLSVKSRVGLVLYAIRNRIFDVK